MKNKTTSLIFATSLVLGFEAAQAQVLVPFDPPPSVRGNAADADTNQRMDAGFFLQSASMDNKIEILKGDLAATRASTQPVKDLAQMLVTDHKALGDKLNKLVSRKDIEFSKELKPKQQAQIDSLAALSGTAFDRAYLADQVMAHTNAIALFEKAGAHNADADVRTFAETALPMLRKHLDMVHECGDKTGLAAAGPVSAMAMPSGQQQ